jgi:hypothetical protein
MYTHSSEGYCNGYDSWTKDLVGFHSCFATLLFKKCIIDHVQLHVGEGVYF